MKIKTKPLNIFLAYSRRDEELRDELVRHMSIFDRQGMVSTWYDRQISPGDNWRNEIDSHLRNAHIILLLISSDFLASDYCYDIEVKQAIKQHKSKQSRVVPIILRPVEWEGAPFSNLQALPKDGKPITTWENRDQAFLNVVNGIRRVIDEITGENKKQHTRDNQNKKSLKVNKKPKVRWVLVLSATISEVDKPQVEAIVKHLQSLSGDSQLTLQKVEEGSINLVLDSSQAGFEKIKRLFDEGQLSEISDINIKNVETRISNLRNKLAYIERKFDTGRAMDVTPETIKSILIEITELVKMPSEYDTNVARDIQDTCYAALNSYMNVNERVQFYSLLRRLVQMLKSLV